MVKFIEKSICLLIFFTVTSFLTYCTLYPQHMRGFLIIFYDFTEISDNIYVSNGTSDSQKKYLSSIVEKAKVKIDTTLWDSFKSKPKIIFLHDSTLSTKFLSSKNIETEFLYTPFFSQIVIDNRNLDLDHLSHEICHAELNFRFGFLGYYKMNNILPAWFNEGLSMQVDDTYSYKDWQEYSQKNKENVPTLEKIYSNSYFYSTNTWYNYMYSKYQVESWLKKVGKHGLDELTERINKFENFYTAYNDIENKYSKNVKINTQK